MSPLAAPPFQGPEKKCPLVLEAAFFLLSQFTFILLTWQAVVCAHPATFSKGDRLNLAHKAAL